MKLIITGLLIIFLSCTIALGDTLQSPGQSDKPAENGWKYSVTPYAWLIAMHNKATIHDHSAETNIYFSDIFNTMDMGGELHFEAKKEKWGFFIDPTYLKISANGTLSDGRDVRMTAEEWLVEFGGLYQLGKWSLDERKSRFITLDALAGGRFFSIKTDLDTSSPINPSKSTDWLDPIIGARVIADITDRMLLTVWADVGGFGVGSDFSYNVSGLLGYRFTRTITGLAGYRVLYSDYKAGSNSVRYLTTLHGPIIGLSFSF